MDRGDESSVRLTALVETSGPGVSQAVVWSSSDTSVVRVNQSEVASGICGIGGIAAITATSRVDPTVRATARVMVMMLDIARITIARITTTAGTPALVDSLTGSVDVVVNYSRWCGRLPLKIAIAVRQRMVEAIVAEHVLVVEHSRATTLPRRSSRCFIPTCRPRLHSGLARDDAV
jgi:hypothetical protein